jgi:hypothetical protein
MSSSITTTTAPEPAAVSSKDLEGVPVHDAQGYRLGLVETADQDTGRLTVVQAGYVLGLLANTFEVPAEWVLRADRERVELAVPESAIEYPKDLILA